MASLLTSCNPSHHCDKQLDQYPNGKQAKGNVASLQSVLTLKRGRNGRVLGDTDADTELLVRHVAIGHR